MKSPIASLIQPPVRRLISAAVGLSLAAGAIGIQMARAQTWHQTTAPVAGWIAVTASADGMRLAALATNGQAILISTNGGADWTWSHPTNGLALGTCLTCSADGRVLVSGGARDSTGEFPGNIIISTNFGASWFTANTPYLGWTGVASSADGTMLVGVSGFRRSFGGGIMTSTDSGATWSPTSAASVDINYNGVASRADGVQLMAVTDFIDLSVTAGATWSTTFAPGSAWTSIAGSADGTRWAAASENNGSGGGQISLSTNSGTNWVQSTAPITNWVSIASSADGARLVAVAAGTGIVPEGAIYQSTDSGATWTFPTIPLGNWSSVASSADGGVLVAAVRGGHIYTLGTAHPPVLGLQLANGQAVVSWIQPSSNFVLQQNTDPTSSNWTDVTGAPVLNLTNLRQEFSVPQSNGAVFYRLVAR